MHVDVFNVESDQKKKKRKGGGSTPEEEEDGYLRAIGHRLAEALTRLRGGLLLLMNTAVSPN